VVEGADEVIVTLTDKREFKAKIVGSDKRTDVAVVKIEAAGLPAVKIGDVNRLKVGEWVMAIGSPFRPRQLRHGRHRQRQAARYG
jgi:serine protease Do